MKTYQKTIITFIACAITGIVTVFFMNLSPWIVAAGLFCIGMMLAIFRNPKYGLFIVAFLLPFERIGSFELAGTTIRASQIFALVTIIAWILIFLTKKINLNAKNPTIIPILLFSGFSILSMINATNLTRAVIIFIFNAFVMMVSVMIPNLIKSKKTLNKVLKILLMSCFAVSLFGIYQFLGDMVGLPTTFTGLREHYTQEVFGFPRVQSTALEPLYFANYLLIPLGLGIAFILGKRKKDDQLPFSMFWITIITGLAGVNLILTLSRGGFLGLLVLVFLAAIFYFKSLFSPFKIALMIIIGLIAVSSAFYFLEFTGDDKNIDVFIKQATEFNEGAGIEERFTTYDEAINLIKTHPIIGSGVGNFGPHVDRSPVNAPNDGWAIVNNETLELWAETGILGLGSIAALVIILIIRSMRALLKSTDNYLKAIVAGLTISFIAILAQYQTFSILYILHIWFLIGLIVSVQNLLLYKEEK